MSKSKEPIFKCPNDIKISVAKHTGEVVLDEECCTSVSVILKNTGEIATSFFGAHNPEVVRMLEKTLKLYFKSIKKTLRSEYKKESQEEIKVVSETLPDKDKWNGEPVPEVKEEAKEKWIKETTKKLSQESVKKPSSKTSNKTNTITRKTSSTKKSASNKKTTK